MSLDGGRKLGYPEGTYTNTGKRCKLHAERTRPRIKARCSNSFPSWKVYSFLGKGRASDFKMSIPAASNSPTNPSPRCALRPCPWSSWTGSETRGQPWWNTHWEHVWLVPRMWTELPLCSWRHGMAWPQLLVFPTGALEGNSHKPSSSPQNMKMDD